MEILWKSAVSGKCAFQQNNPIRKLGEILVFDVVKPLFYCAWSGRYITELNLLRVTYRTVLIILAPLLLRWAGGLRIKPRSRSSHQKCSVRKGVLSNWAKFTEIHLCQGLFLNKVAGFKLTTLLKKRLWHRCFLVNFAKILRRPLFIEHFWWLLLHPGTDNARTNCFFTQN